MLAWNWPSFLIGVAAVVVVLFIAREVRH